MINTINQGGLLTAKQFKSNNIEEILSWHSTEMLQECPVVIFF
jgi:hypothetical protein